jgi:hypothetical protein
LKFARLGGLSPVKYHRAKPGADPSFSYPPPRRKGLYAFIWPYLSPFFYMWKVSKILNKKGIETYNEEKDCQTLASNKMFHAIGYRVFEYEGPVWTHLAVPNEWPRAWTKVTTQELRILLAKEKRLLAKDLMKSYLDETWSRQRMPVSQAICDDPFKRGRNGMYAKDHLEIFIEKKDLGKIK